MRWSGARVPCTQPHATLVLRAAPSHVRDLVRAADAETEGQARLTTELLAEADEIAVQGARLEDEIGRPPRPFGNAPVEVRRANEATALDFGVGTRVEVRDRFCSSWSRGFEVAATTDRGYILRRVSDRYVLPIEFDAGEVCRAR